MSVVGLIGYKEDVKDLQVTAIKVVINRVAIFNKKNQEQIVAAAVWRDWKRKRKSERMDEG